MTAYDAAVRRLADAQRQQIDLGLGRTEQLLERLGSPQTGLSGVLVAGTNGKGSVCAMLESVGRAAGNRTVLLTKPHLRSWTERIAIDGIPITEDNFTSLANEVCDYADSRFWPESQPTQFELLTAMGILAASRTADSFVVCEVGLGGRLDSTNVLDLGAAIVTNIGRDHIAYLGESLTAIAAEKAAIIKPGNTVVTAATEPARGVVATRAMTLGAKLTVIERGVTWTGRTLGRAGVRVDLDSPKLALRSRLCGSVQLENVAVAATMARLLGFRNERIQEGIAQVTWPGRLQWIDGDPPVLIDGAHNPPALKYLAASVPDLANGRRVVGVFGAMRDKQLAEMLPLIRTLTPEVVLTAVEDERAAPPEMLAESFGGGYAIAGVSAAIDFARELAGRDGIVVICGSLALAGAALEYLSAED